MGIVLYCHTYKSVSPVGYRYLPWGRSTSHWLCAAWRSGPIALWFTNLPRHDYAVEFRFTIKNAQWQVEMKSLSIRYHLTNSAGEIPFQKGEALMIAKEACSALERLGFSNDAGEWNGFKKKHLVLLHLSKVWVRNVNDPVSASQEIIGHTKGSRLPPLFNPSIPSHSQFHFGYGEIYCSWFVLDYGAILCFCRSRGEGVTSSRRLNYISSS